MDRGHTAFVAIIEPQCRAERFSVGTEDRGTRLLNGLHSPLFNSARDERDSRTRTEPTPGLPGGPPAGARAGPALLLVARGETRPSGDLLVT